MRWPAWVGTPRAEGVIRALALVLLCAVIASVSVDWARAPQEDLRIGDVAPRTVKAPVTFKFQDFDAYERERLEAESRELPVFVHEPEMGAELQLRVRTAWANGRALLAAAAAPNGATPEAKDVRHTIGEQFHRDLRVNLVDEDIDALTKAGFSQELEALTADLLRDAMNGMVVADRADLPRDTAGIRVVVGAPSPSEQILTDLEGVTTAQDARQQISLRAMDRALGSSAAGKAAGAVARALVRANLTFSPGITEDRRDKAVQSVRVAPESVKRGTVLFREGDTLSERQVRVYAALAAQQGDHAIALEWMSVVAFILLLVSTTYGFGASYLDRFSTRVRDVASGAALLGFTAVLARVVVVSSEEVATLIGYEAEASSVWFVLPLAGVVMLVRLLMGMSWALLFTVVASVVAGLVMDLQALPMVYFLISGFTAAAAVEHTRERIAVLRAGLQVALVNAAAVLVIHFLQLYGVDGEVTLATTMRPLWSMVFALAGGIGSAFLVLGLTPLFETFGFVTDYRLMELANLNHPLMRQLMLRAPGSYHHSVMVGSLAEAAAEAIGANALQAKVAAYFHDIGKSLKPQFFVENQGAAGNRHQGLDPYTSAQIIISHVTEGGRMAAEHNLPKPIQDNIWMHHGTGILQYFFAKAQEELGDVDEMPFRYPGPKPSTREAGIIMLADKVEAATRTIKSPTEENIRLMITRIVNSVMADGQFSECPLTFQEIHTIADTFVTVLVSIYHQRIEYPDTAAISGRGQAARPSAVPRDALITLELHPLSQSQPASQTRDELPEDPDTDATPVSPGVIAQGQQRKVPETPPPALRRRTSGGDELPPPVTAPLDGAYSEGSPVADYEAVQYLPRGEG